MKETHRQVSDEVLLVIENDVKSTLAQNPFSHLPSKFDYDTRSLPSQKDVMELLSSNIHPIQDAALIRSSKEFSMLNPSIVDKGDSISATEFVDMWLWDKGQFISSGILERIHGLKALRCARIDLLKSDWVKDRSISFNELAVIQSTKFANLPWDTITMGEFASTVDIDRTMHFDLMPHGLKKHIPRSGSFHDEFRDLLIEWRKYCQTNEAFSCALMSIRKQQTTNHPTQEWRDLLHDFSCKDVYKRPFLTASPSSIRGTLTNDVDDSLISSLFNQ
jgi:hypothetical protein